MSDVLNLNRFRKRKQQVSEREQAERNRIVHGRSKVDKQLGRLERERADKQLEGHRLGAAVAEDESLDGLASDDGEDDSLPDPE